MMRLARAEIENFQKITVIDITFGDRVTEISGPNGAGKSSVFKALHSVIDQRATPADPIRHGADTSAIRLSLEGGKEGLLYVKKRYRTKPNGEMAFDLEISTPDGGIYDRAPTLLKKMLGAHLLDPLEFIGMKPHEQLEVLKSFVPNFDFEANAREHKGVFTRRTAVGQEYERENGAAQAIRVPADTPREIIEVGELSAQVEQAIAHNADIQRRADNRARAREQITELRAKSQQTTEALPGNIQRIEDTLKSEQIAVEKQIEALQEQIRLLTGRQEQLVAKAEQDIAAAREHCKQTISSLSSQAETLENKLNEAGDLPAEIPAEHIQRLRDQIASATRLNGQVKDRIDRDKHAAAARTLDQTYVALTKQLGAIDKARQDAIAAANLPIPGLGFGDGCVMLNGAPFEQASQGEKMRTAFVLVALGQSGELRFCYVSDASLLDDANRALVEQLAQEHDLQVLLETVKPGSGSAIILEDGHVKGVEPEFKLTAPKKPVAPDVARGLVTEEQAREQLDLAPTPAPTEPEAAPTRKRKPWTGPGAPTGDVA